MPTESKSSITEAKFNDLQNLFINIIPLRHHEFFKGFALSPRKTQLKQKRTGKKGKNGTGKSAANGKKPKKCSEKLKK